VLSTFAYPLDVVSARPPLTLALALYREPTSVPDSTLVSKSLRTPWMTAIAGKFHGAAGVAAILAAVIAVFRSLAIASGVSAFFGFHHRFIPSVV
jgi:hypothetical protein